ncbi:MAG: hypothetical protein ACI8QF_002250 [Limisphaerales bacterium]|jgi:hypothetical protein
MMHRFSQLKPSAASSIPCVILALSALLLSSADSQAAEPWRLDNQLNTPDWFRFSGEYRVRYETLDGQFRTTGIRGDQALATRLLLEAALDYKTLTLVGELADSRQYLNDAGSPLNSGMVNTLEPLQAYLRWDASELLDGDQKASLTLGRQSFDLGSRRLFARNRYRNTLNAFNGARAQWTFSGGQSLQAMYLFPVHRLPTSRASLLDNDSQLDRESFDYQFWGAFFDTPTLPWNSTGEFYLFGLHENDDAKRSTRNRQLITPGFRVHRKPARGALDYQLESVFQFGRSRATTAAADTRDLAHLAHFQHLTLGYTFDSTWSPRVAFQYDYASGDSNPADGQNNRFDTLFGARRFEHGPTGVFGAFARGNINSPGYRLILKPRANLELMAAHRLYWLASDTDAWTTSGLRDATGAAGHFVGNQIEARARWDVFPKNLRLEAGVARLFAGEFIRNAPNNTGQRDATYGYFQAALKF